MMQGIDISSWQSGIDLASVPCDFAIIKATQNTSYTNPDCVRTVEQAIRLGMPFGVYHYVGGAGAVAEADFFIDSVANWVGKGILVIDWEAGENQAWGNTEYLSQLVTRVIDRTGVPPIIYASLSVFPWDIASRHNCGTWVAQYADNNSTGYQETPWNEGAYQCTIRQYSSCGNLSGWSGRLDLNKAYITAEQWTLYANPSGTIVEQPAAPPHDDKSTLGLLIGVMLGYHGNGDARRESLGDMYDSIQGIIDHIDSADAQTLAEEVWEDKYGSGEDRKVVLGRRYSEVMDIVNGGKSHVVRQGETLSGIAEMYGTTWQAIAEKNSIDNPSLIYAGQVFTI